jgi:hypothetical protein
VVLAAAPDAASAYTVALDDATAATPHACASLQVNDGATLQLKSGIDLRGDLTVEDGGTVELLNGVDATSSSGFMLARDSCVYRDDLNNAGPNPYSLSAGNRIVVKSGGHMFW